MKTPYLDEDIDQDGHKVVSARDGLAVHEVEEVHDGLWGTHHTLYFVPWGLVRTDAHNLRLGTRPRALVLVQLVGREANY